MDEVDEVNEDDSDSTEEAVAAAIAALVLAHDPASHEPAAPTGAWASRVTAAIGPTLVAFLLRTARSFNAAAGEPLGPNEVRQLADSVQERAVEQAGHDVETLYDNVRRGYVDPDTGIESVSRERVRNGAEIASNRLVNASREQLRLSFARTIGATAKTWRTQRDRRVRDMHVALEGTTIPLDELFRQPDGALLEAPSDPSAPLSATARCRCRLSFRLVPV